MSAARSVNVLTELISLHPFTSTCARECLLSESIPALRPLFVMLLQYCRLRERSAVRFFSTRSPLSVNLPWSSFSVRSWFRSLRTC